MNISQNKLLRGAERRKLSNQLILEYGLTGTSEVATARTAGPFDVGSAFWSCAKGWGDFVVVNQTRVFKYNNTSVIEVPTITPVPVQNGIVGVEDANWIYYIAADGYTYVGAPKNTSKDSYNITKLTATAGSSEIVGVGQDLTQYGHSYVKAAAGIYRLRGTAAYKLSFTQMPSWHTYTEINNQNNGTAALTTDQLGAYIMNNAITSLTPNQTPTGTLIDTSPNTRTFQGDIISQGIMYCYQTTDSSAPYVIWDVNVYSSNTLYLRQLCTSQTKPTLLPGRMVVRNSAVYYYHPDGTEQALNIYDVETVGITSDNNCLSGTIYVLTGRNELYRIVYADESNPPSNIRTVGYTKNGVYVDLAGPFAVKQLYEGYEL